MQMIFFALGALTAALIFAAGGAFLALSILIAWS